MCHILDLCRDGLAAGGLQLLGRCQAGHKAPQHSCFEHPCCCSKAANNRHKHQTLLRTWEASPKPKRLSGGQILSSMLVGSRGMSAVAVTKLTCLVIRRLSTPRQTKVRPDRSFEEHSQLHESHGLQLSDTEGVLQTLPRAAADNRQAKAVVSQLNNSTQCSMQTE